MTHQTLNRPRCDILVYPSGATVLAVDPAGGNIATLRINHDGVVAMPWRGQLTRLAALPALALPLFHKRGALVVDTRTGVISGRHASELSP